MIGFVSCKLLPATAALKFVLRMLSMEKGRGLTVDDEDADETDETAAAAESKEAAAAALAGDEWPTPAAVNAGNKGRPGILKNGRKRNGLWCGAGGRWGRPPATALPPTE